MLPSKMKNPRSVMLSKYPSVDGDDDFKNMKTFTCRPENGVHSLLAAPTFAMHQQQLVDEVVYLYNKTKVQTATKSVTAATKKGVHKNGTSRQCLLLPPATFAQQAQGYTSSMRSANNNGK